MYNNHLNYVKLCKPSKLHKLPSRVKTVRKLFHLLYEVPFWGLTYLYTCPKIKISLQSSPTYMPYMQLTLKNLSPAVLRLIECFLLTTLKHLF